MTKSPQVVVLAGSSLPVSDPVPAYEPRHCTSEEIKPGYVSQSMHEVWQAAQDKHERKKSIKSPQFIWLKALGMGKDSNSTFCTFHALLLSAHLDTVAALAAVTIIGTNAATVYCSTIFMQRITSISNTLDNRDEGLIAGISGLSDDYKLSYPTLAKAAALAGLLTSLPALLVGLYALALKRKLDKMREDDAWVVV